MTNRLLGIVIALALTSGVVAHAASAPQRPLAPVSLPTASNLPAALQTAASRISEAATSAIDPGAAAHAAPRGGVLRATEQPQRGIAGGGPRRHPNAKANAEANPDPARAQPHQYLWREQARPGAV